MRLAQNAAQYLLHVYLTAPVGKRGQYIGKGAVPSFFQCIHRNDISYRALTAHQVNVLQFVLVGCLYLHLFLRDASLNQLSLDFLEVDAFVIHVRLSLKQHNRTHVSFCALCHLLQFFTECHCTRYHVVGTLMVIHDDGQFHHVGPFQPHGIHKTDDVACPLGGCRQFVDEAGVDVL